MFLRTAFSAAVDSAASHSPEDVRKGAEEKIQAHVARRQIGVTECFSDFDSLHSGRITPDQFRRGLARLGVVLDPREVDVLVDAYEVVVQGQKLTNYREFCLNIDEVFSYRLSVKDPMATPQDSKTFLQTYKSSNKSYVQSLQQPNMTDEDKERLQKGIEMVAQEAKRARTLLKPYFRDYDKLNSGVVTKDQFWRTLSSLSLKIPPGLIELIYWQYASPQDPDYVDYRSFCADVNPPSELMRPSLTDTVAHILTGNMAKLNLTKKPADVEKVMKKLRRVVLKRNIQISDAFEDYDKLRSGGILPHRFRSLLKDYVNCSLSDEEMEALHKKYAFTGDSSKVDYVAFTADLNAVYTVASIAKDPTATLPEFNLDDDDSEEEKDEEEEKATDQLIERLRTSVKARGVAARALLAAHDHHNMGVVTVNKLASVLSTLGLQVTPQELQLLHQRYKREERIKYQELCNDIGA